MDYLRSIEPEVINFEYDNSYKYTINSINTFNPINSGQIKNKPTVKSKEKYLYFILVYYNQPSEVDTVRVSYNTLVALKAEFPNKFKYKYNSCCLRKCLFGEKGDV